MLTRRDVIKGGVAAGLVLTFGRISVAQAEDAEESYLHRSFWAGQEGASFGALKLRSVEDVSERLAGRDDCFRLTFSGAPGAAAGMTDLGGFELFVAPVGAEGDRFEVIVDRSIPLPRNAPTPPSAPQAPVAKTSSVAPKKGVQRVKPAKPTKLSRKAKRRRAKMLKQLARKYKRAQRNR